jgi:hypothetical protein
VTYCGTSAAGSAGLTMQNVPFYEEVAEFVQMLEKELNSRGLNYGIGAEHAHSCCILLADSTRFKRDGRWATRICTKARSRAHGWKMARSLAGDQKTTLGQTHLNGRSGATRASIPEIRESTARVGQRLRRKLKRAPWRGRRSERQLWSSSQFEQLNQESSCSHITILTCSFASCLSDMLEIDTA